MQDLFAPVRQPEPSNPARNRYAIVFEPTQHRQRVALQFTGDADRVLTYVDRDVEWGTTAATLLSLLRLLAKDPLARVLVLLPAREGQIPVFVGEASELAMMVRRHSPTLWTALNRCFFRRDAVPGVCAELLHSDLARDILALKTRARLTVVPGGPARQDADDASELAHDGHP